MSQKVQEFNTKNFEVAFEEFEIHCRKEREEFRKLINGLHPSVTRPEDIKYFKEYYKAQIELIDEVKDAILVLSRYVNDKEKYYFYLKEGNLFNLLKAMNNFLDGNRSLKRWNELLAPALPPYEDADWQFLYEPHGMPTLHRNRALLIGVLTAAFVGSLCVCAVCFHFLGAGVICAIVLGALGVSAIAQQLYHENLTNHMSVLDTAIRYHCNMFALR
jgi:hypothetical protein